MRIITFSPYQTHTAPIFYNLNILKMEDIVHLKTAIVAYKTLNVTEMSKTNIVQICNPTFLDEIHKYSTRLKNKEIL